MSQPLPQGEGPPPAPAAAAPASRPGVLGWHTNRQRVRYSALDILNSEPGAGARRIATHLLWEMRRYTGLSSKSDDATILVVRVGTPAGD